MGTPHPHLRGRCLLEAPGTLVLAQGHSLPCWKAALEQSGVKVLCIQNQKRMRRGCLGCLGNTVEHFTPVIDALRLRETILRSPDGSWIGFFILWLLPQDIGRRTRAPTGSYCMWCGSSSLHATRSSRMLSCFILQLSVGILRPLPNQTMTATLTNLDALGASQLRTSLQLISFWHPCNSLAPKATCCANCCATPNSDLAPKMLCSSFQQNLEQFRPVLHRVRLPTPFRCLGKAWLGALVCPSRSWPGNHWSPAICGTSQLNSSQLWWCGAATWLGETGRAQRPQGPAVGVAKLQWSLVLLAAAGEGQEKGGEAGSGECEAL